jgi:hypothetical protein
VPNNLHPGEDNTEISAVSFFKAIGLLLVETVCGEITESELTLFHPLLGHKVYYQAQKTKPEKYSQSGTGKLPPDFIGMISKD